MTRLSGGAAIDRSRVLAFSFDGRRYTGFAGDTLASALLANGVRVVARSFKLHRPRGVFSAGLEEPNAIVTVGEGALREVNVRATDFALYDGLVARSQNCWPSVNVDAAALIGAFAHLLPAGFYHKTFKWPGWQLFEPIVRRLAGLARPASDPDPDRYATQFHHCDVLVIGGGPAGLSAAAAAAARHESVLLLESSAEFGGSLLDESAERIGSPPRHWVAARLCELRATGRVRLLPRTLAFGCYDENWVAAVERLDPSAATHALRQRLWKIRAERIVLACGAIERPLVFANNDRPGVMLASAVRTYVRRYAVCPGTRAVLFTNNDSAYDTALALREHGVEIAAIVDVRLAVNGEATGRARREGIPVHLGHAVVDTHGANSLRAVDIARFDSERSRVAAVSPQTVRCDLLCVSGGWNPTVHLYSQAGGRLDYDETLACFVPAGCDRNIECVGAAAGHWDWPTGGVSCAPIQPLWRVQSSGSKDLRHRQWVDLAYDVTAGDIELAAREGFVSVEHMKRYTANGMALDQGKTSNVNALALLAQASGRRIAEVGTTTFRPAYHPVMIGALAGGRVGETAHRLRNLPVGLHPEMGAVLEDHSGWLRPAYYLRKGESEEQAIGREVHAARHGAALFDASSLGKIEVFGPDAGEFLDRLYVNNVKTLAPGALRYGLMLNDNGVIIDDGVFGCVGPGHYRVNTSSAGTANIHFWMEEWLQCEWRGLRVWIAQQTAQWATLTLSGPKARSVLGRSGIEIAGAGNFDHMQMRAAQFGVVELRVRRASFTGEMSFELDVPADHADSLWRRLLEAGAADEITPIGMEALDILRVEKGFLEVGVDTEGDTTPLDVGWSGAIARKSADFIGRRSLRREAMQSPTRLQLVGLLPERADLRVPVGTHAVDAQGRIDGHVTSGCMSPHLGRSVAMGLIRSGFARKGGELTLDIDGSKHRARIVDTNFYDPRGERLRD